MKSQPDKITKLTWIYISGAASLFFLILAVILILFSSKLAAFGITKSLYYIVLIPVGLTSAAFLFGALRSRAKYTGQASLGTLELSGPVVVFCLVVIGGFYFASPESSFLLTIRTIDVNDEQKILNDGIVYVDFDDQRQYKKLNDNGEVMFAGVSSSFLGKTVRIMTDIKGYKLKDSSKVKIPEDKVIYLPLEKRIDSTKVRGMVINTMGNPLPDVQIDIESGEATGLTDKDGKFSLISPGAEGETVLLTAIKDGTLGYREYIVLNSDKSILIKFAAGL